MWAVRVEQGSRRVDVRLRNIEEDTFGYVFPASPGGGVGLVQFPSFLVVCLVFFRLGEVWLFISIYEQGELQVH